MSYDLYFRFRDPGAERPPEAFLNYFRSRPYYQATNTDVLYSNESTGVYFSFDVQPQSVSDGDTEIPNLAPVAFNLNYFRPHVFGLEAEPELAAFVEAFDLLVWDPESVMTDGEYSSEGFLQGWNSGNLFGYRAALAHEEALEFRTLPTAALESVWRWNYTRDQRQQEYGDELFVPRIYLMEYYETLCTGVAWGDAHPILLPRVDLVLAARKHLAPRKLFRKVEDVVVFRWSEAEPFIGRYRIIEGVFPAHELKYTTPPPELENLVRSQNPPEQMPQGFNTDKVLNRELLEQARAD